MFQQTNPIEVVPPPAPTNNFQRMKMTPTNYISLEREFNGEQDLFEIVGKYFYFVALWAIFENWLRKGSAMAPEKNVKLLKYEHIIYSFEARDLEICEYLSTFAKYLNFAILRAL